MNIFSSSNCCRKGTREKNLTGRLHNVDCSCFHHPPSLSHSETCWSWMTTSSVVVPAEHGTDTATGTITTEAAVGADVLFLENAPTCHILVPIVFSWEMSLRYTLSTYSELLVTCCDLLLPANCRSRVPIALVECRLIEHVTCRRSLEKKRPVAQVNGSSATLVKDELIKPVLFSVIHAWSHNDLFSLLLLQAFSPKSRKIH